MSDEPTSQAVVGALPARRAVVYLLAAVVLVVADQATKLAALEWLEPGRPVVLASNLNLVLAFNTGAAFSLLGDAGGWQRWLFIGLGIAAVAAICAWLVLSRTAVRLERAALTLVLGGAAGNLLDRVFRGSVVDFVDVHVNDWHWPVFNLADSAICVGVAIMIWLSLRPMARE